MIRRTGTWPPPCAVKGCGKERRANSDVCVQHHIERVARRQPIEQLLIVEPVHLGQDIGAIQPDRRQSQDIFAVLQGRMRESGVRSVPRRMRSVRIAAAVSTPSGAPPVPITA